MVKKEVAWLASMSPSPRWPVLHRPISPYPGSFLSEKGTSDFRSTRRSLGPFLDTFGCGDCLVRICASTGPLART